MLQQTTLEHYLEIKEVVLLKVFKIPYDTKREEKIFGGYLSLRQVIYLMLNCSLIGIFFLHINIIIKFITFTTFSILLLLCVFFKIQELNFDKFFFYAIKYLFRKKKFIYER